MRQTIALALATTTLLAAPATAALASTWSLDASHADVAFSVRHMMVSNTKGRFNGVKGTLEIDDKDVTKSKIEVEIDVKTVDTREPKRDEHLRAPDFFDVAKFPTMTFKSKSVAKAGAGLKITGDLTIRGVTKSVVLDATLTDAIKTPFGTTVRAVAASTKISRKDFGLSWNKAIEAGGVAVGDEVTISIDAEFVQK